MYPLLQAGPSPADPAASLRELEAAVRATLCCDISCWDHGRMRDLMANGGSGGYMDDDAEPVWSEAAIAHIEAVLLELEQATPALAEAPQEFRKYLVRAHAPLASYTSHTYLIVAG